MASVIKLRRLENTYGPRQSIGASSPPGAVEVTTASNIQALINANGTGTTFWLRAGIYDRTANLVPKTGNTFIGEYGAILDGSNWEGAGVDDAAFQALNVDADDVTISNLFIRNMPGKGVMGYRDFASGWIIEYCEVHGCLTGIEFPPASTLRYNSIHHNIGDPLNVDPGLRGGGYIGNQAHGSTIEYNEIAFNGPEQKLILTNNMTFRRNWVHHHDKDGIWIDGDGGGGGALIEDNRVEDHGRDGIVMENVTGGGIIRRNVMRRNAEAILLADAQGFDIAENTLEANTISLAMLKDLDEPSRDLANNFWHDNTVQVPGAGGGIRATQLQIVGTGDSSPYLTNTKNNDYDSNTYDVGNVTDTVFEWDGLKAFAAWQALPQDINGSAS